MLITLTVAPKQSICCPFILIVTLGLSCIMSYLISPSFHSFNASISFRSFSLSPNFYFLYSCKSFLKNLITFQFTSFFSLFIISTISIPLFFSCWEFELFNTLSRLSPLLSGPRHFDYSDICHFLYICFYCRHSPYFHYVLVFPHFSNLNSFHTFRWVYLRHIPCIVYCLSNLLFSFFENCYV